MRRKHADHGVRLAIDDQLPADDGAVAAESELPELMADHREVRIELGACFRRRERPAARDGSARYVEKVRSDKHRHDRDGGGPPSNQFTSPSIE